jgi:GNAT superfamily N-acetyltransferase
MSARSGAVAIRRIRAEEGLALRELRLAALAAAPAAFGSTLAAEQAYPEDAWHQRARRGAAGQDVATFIAQQSGLWVGLATGLAGSGGDSPGPQLVGMFVAEPVRRQGVASALIAAVAAWARATGADDLRLWVAAANAPALAVYRRSGFRPTGARRASPNWKDTDELEMALAL